MFLRKQYLPTINMFRTLKKFKPRGPNAGINRQNRLLEENNSQEILNNDTEIMENMESDFMNVHLTHKQSEKEARTQQEKLKHRIIKQKYFNVKKPNFLLYAEKEQIKLLHGREPTEWTPEKLSESFPADYETICKILKAKWVAVSKQRIEKHDHKVLENWNSFKNGQFPELPLQLKEHLHKFTERSLDHLKNLNYPFEITTLKLPMPTKTEFLDIITKYGPKNENQLIESDTNNLIDENRSLVNNLSPDESYLEDKVVNRTPLRFQDLNISPSQYHKKIENNLINNPTGTGKIQHVNKFKTNSVKISENKDLFSDDDIEENIIIPKNLWKNNATYKVKDCYYDDDGEFLYRVPGMTN